MQSQQVSKSPERLELERKAAAVLELQRRDKVKRNQEKTVYGIFRPSPNGPEHVRSIQEQNGEYVETDKPYVVTVPEKLERLITTKKRFKIPFGGRSGAKSNTIGAILAAQAKDYGIKSLCLRELQNSIEDSVHALIKSEIERFGFEGFETTNSAIRLNEEDVFKFKGLARNPDSVKSMFGFKRSWVEEAQSLSQDSITMLTPTIREAESELWFSLNPGSSADPISKRFLQPFYNDLLRDGYYEDDLHLVIWINYLDNPWHSEELERERIFDEENLSTAEYRHKWLGHYNDEVEGSIIPVEWFNAAIDAHEAKNFKPQGAKYVTHDPSDNGDDAKGLAYRHGSVFLDVCENLINDVNDGCDWATDYAEDVKADYFSWDCDGLGVSLRRQVSTALRGKNIQYEEFKGSHGVDNPNAPYDPKAEGGKPKSNKDTFKNKRSQYYWALRDRFYNTYRAIKSDEYIDPCELISISSKIKAMDKLRAEVCRIPLQENNNGYIQIMTKKDMKRLHKIESPNMADCMMMSLAVTTITHKKKTVTIPSIRSRRMT